MLCLECKWVEIIEYGCNGRIGETIINCKLCEKITKDMLTCESFEKMIDKQICKSCQCYDCVFDYGLSICSEFGSHLCNNCIGWSCDTCKKYGQRITTDCEEYTPDDLTQ